MFFEKEMVFMQWLLVMRPTACLIPALLVVYSYYLCGKLVNLWAVLATFAIATFAMVLNAYSDRNYDQSKKTGIALTNNQLRLFTWFWAIIALILSVFSVFYFGPDSLVLFVAFVISCTYVFMRSKLFWNNLWVAMANGVVILSPGITEKSAIGLALGIAVIIFGREILKDIIDEEYDKHYKQTFSLRYGKNISVMITIFCYATALLFLLLWVSNNSILDMGSGLFFVAMFVVFVRLILNESFSGYTLRKKNLYVSDFVVLISVLAISL